MSKTKHPVFKCLHRGEKGFTLIELIIVVAIIGILAAVIVPNIVRFLAVGQRGAAEGELRSVQNAAYAAMAEAGVGTVTGGIVSSDGGEISTSPPLTVDTHLQGGIAQLTGIWTVNTAGLVTEGAYPNPADLLPGANYWNYTAPDTWVSMTIP